MNVLNKCFGLITALKNKLVPQLFVIYTRYLLGGAFVFASFIKIKGHRFTSQSGASEPVDSAFHFFETIYQSGLYWKFIGLGQLVAGALLMTQRFAMLGAVINLPIILNVFIITISYDFAGTPLITGMMLLANLFLLIWDWNRLRVLINIAPQFDSPERIEAKRIWEVCGITLLLFTSVYRIYADKYNPVFWFSICSVIGVITLAVAIQKGISQTRIIKKGIPSKRL
jgi:hypothetical protein